MDDKIISIKQLHEPLSPYVSSAYNTLCSVTQGVALGGLFWVLSTEPFTLYLFLKCTVVVLLIGLIWHRYVINDQLVGWHLSPTDTLIPILLVMFQFWLILAIKESIYLFSFAMTVISLGGIAAYQNSYKRSREIASRELLDEHYDGESETFKKDLHDVIVGFSSNERVTMAIVTALMAAITSINYYDKYFSEGSHIIFTTIIMITVILVLFYKDVRWELKNSKSTSISKYNW